MSLGQWIFDDYGVPFILVRADQNLADVRSEMRSKGYQPNHTFLVYCDVRNNVWRAARVNDVLDKESEDPVLLGLETIHLPLAIVDDVISINSDESSDDVVEHLLQFARQVFIIIDDRDKVVGLLTNTEMGSGEKLEPVQFTAIHGRPVVAETESMLLIYAHLNDARDEVVEDAENYANRIGKLDPRRRSGGVTPELKRGTLLKVVPEIEKQYENLITFKQAWISGSWDYDWEVFPFTFTTHADAAGIELAIHVSIQIAGIEIADINVRLEVVEQSKPAGSVTSTAAQIHQRIFISYAREDAVVVRRYYKAQIAAANTVFLDVESIRAGEYWRTAVKDALDKADFVQLFWSEHSAQSRNVRFEWEYFINNRCTGGNCDGRLRPVYWKEPLPPIPPELKSVNFSFVDMED